jgi:hypothetical protein
MTYAKAQCSGLHVLALVTKAQDFPGQFILTKMSMSVIYTLPAWYKSDSHLSHTDTVCLNFLDLLTIALLHAILGQHCPYVLCLHSPIP